VFVVVLTSALACSSSDQPPTGQPDSAPPADDAAPPAPDTAPDQAPAAKPDAAVPDAPVAPDADTPDTEPAAPGTFCAMGSDIAGTKVPPGFCLRHFADVPEARTLTFAPNGDLFVGSPSVPTPGGAGGGHGTIVVLSDDDHDGVAEAHNFAEKINDVHGLAIGPGYLYFTTAADVWRTPYAAGQRSETGPRESMGMPQKFGNGGRWAHGLALSAGGQLYASRGEYSACTNSPGGEIDSVTMGSTQVVANGFRNPMYMRCHHKDEVCAAAELGEDQMTGAREKFIGLHPNTNYGYPCCYSTDMPVAVAPAGVCGPVTREDAAFPLSDTPFGLDWEHDLWSEPYHGAVFVALHGSFYSSPSWAGARVVFARTNPDTHMPAEDWRDFVTGFGPEGSPLERPSDVAFAPDGRLFFSDDHGGGVYWVAPTTLRRSN
jgi:glucose/arabinose dehydrogenase